MSVYFWKTKFAIDIAKIDLDITYKCFVEGFSFQGNSLMVPKPHQIDPRLLIVKLKDYVSKRGKKKMMRINHAMSWAQWNVQKFYHFKLYNNVKIIFSLSDHNY